MANSYTVDFEINETIKKALLRFGISDRLLTRLKKHDGIKVNEVQQTVRYVLKENDVLTVCMNDKEYGLKDIPATNYPIDVLYEDEYILIVNKAQGLSIHPTIDNYHNSLANHIRYYFDKKNIQNIVRISTRLDKNTSGIVIIAKDAYVSDLINSMIKNGCTDKYYLALLCGILENDIVIDKPIARKTDSNIEREINWELGKKAVSHFIIQKKYKNATLVMVKLITGRTHQIRVHAKSIGHSLIGDDLYGSDTTFSGQFLHCTQVCFRHPITNDSLIINAELPNNMKKFLDGMEI